MAKRNISAIETRRIEGARLLKRKVAQAEVARRMGVTRQSVNVWAQQLAEANGAVGKLKARALGRPKHLDARQCQELCSILLKGALAAGFATELWTIKRVRALIERAFADLPRVSAPVHETPPRAVSHTTIRTKDLEQSHVCLGASDYRQNHDDRYGCYVLNTMLGGSMSSRLFQNVREKRGLAYAVFSGLSAYRDAGSMTIYAGCANHAVGELIDVVIAELRRMKDEPLPESELRRAKDHLKGSLMLSLENTASRMSHLARQEIYFDHQFELDETLAGVERVTAEDVQRVAIDLFKNDSFAATVLGHVNGLEIPRERLALE